MTKRLISALLIISAAVTTWFFFSQSPSQKIVIAGTDAGLGNQLFVYAAGYALSKRLNSELWVIADPEPRAFTSQDRAYALDFFKIKADRYITGDDYKHFKHLTHVTEANFHTLTPQDGQVFLLTECFDAEKFFNDQAHEIALLFEPIPADTAQPHLAQIQSTESVAVHVRRGDFTNFPARLLPLSYQLRAMAYLRQKLKNPHFFIFCDDPDYAASSFRNDNDVTIVSNKASQSIDEFRLMRACKHIITANSTYSWWAAWLNPNPDKIVIAPLPRYRDDFYDQYPADQRNDKIKRYTQEAYPASWITLNPFS